MFGEGDDALDVQLVEVRLMQLDPRERNVLREPVILAPVDVVGDSLAVRVFRARTYFGEVPHELLLQSSLGILTARHPRRRQR